MTTGSGRRDTERVTGGAGAIGSAIVAALRSGGGRGLVLR